MSLAAMRLTLLPLAVCQAFTALCTAAVSAGPEAAIITLIDWPVAAPDAAALVSAVVASTPAVVSAAVPAAAVSGALVPAAAESAVVISTLVSELLVPLEPHAVNRLATIPATTVTLHSFNEFFLWLWWG